MLTGVDRRAFIGGLVSSAAACLTFSAAPAHAARAAQRLRSDGLREGLHLISGGGGNVLLGTGNGSAVLVDSGAPRYAGALLDTVESLTDGQPVRVVFNTQWHPEHTGGNDLLAEAGASIIAHENTRLWMRQPVFRKWERREYEARAPQALPTRTFFASDPQPGVLDVGGLRVEYGALRPSHTDGDMYVRFPDANVLAAGRVVAAAGYPLVDYSTGGWLVGMVESLDMIAELSDAETIIVPGEGTLRSRDDVLEQRHMLATVLERVEERMRRGYGVEELLADGVTDEFDADWGDPAAFMEHTYHSLWWRAAGTI